MHPDTLPIIDTHQHLWDLQLLRLPWLEGGGPLARSFLMADYLREAEGLPILCTLYMEVDVDPAQHAAEADYVVALCRQPDNPMEAAVIGGRPGSEDFRVYLDRFRQCPEVKGVRQVLHGRGTPPGFCLQPSFVRGIRLLGERGLRFDLCLPATSLRDGAQLADACPDTQLILDHCGNAPVQTDDLSPWKRAIEDVARRRNVVVKISGIVASARPGFWTPDELAPIIRHAAEVFGPDRLLFASDWPVCTRTASLRQWIEALQSVVSDWPEEHRHKLFHENARRFYDLP